MEATESGCESFHESANKLRNLVNEQDVIVVAKTQQATSQRLEKCNEMLINCNQLTSRQLASVGEKFQRHTLVLQEMRRDLHSIYSRIRNLKSKMALQYPTEFSLAQEDEMQNISHEDNVAENGNSKIVNQLYDSASKAYFNAEANSKH